jgi:hypothetical protein
LLQSERDKKRSGEVMLDGVEVLEMEDVDMADFESPEDLSEVPNDGLGVLLKFRRELFEIRELLTLEVTI